MKINNKEIRFIPIFGNERHIRILSLYGNVEKARKELAKKLKAAKDSKALREEIRSTEERILHLLNQIKQ